MKAIVIRNPGRQGRMEPTDAPDPAPGPGSVLVAVRATGLNRADLLQCRGLYPPPPGFDPLRPGLEFAGEVLDRGPGNGPFAPGDRVMGILGGEGHAGKVAVPDRHCLPVPPNLDWTEAAAVPEAFLTAWDALFVRGNLAEGESVLIHAAGSGVGTAAVQLAAAAGCRVTALTRSPDKAGTLLELGACQVADPGDLRPIDPGSVDVVLDLTGGPEAGRNLQLLAPRGRWVLAGLLGGSRAELDLADLLARRVTLTGTVLRSRSDDEKAALVRRFGREALPLLVSGKLKPVVYRTFPPAAIGEAVEVMRRNENLGKIVLRWEEP